MNMMPEEDKPVSRVTVGFHSSSTKDGREAYTITVLEGAEAKEAARVMGIAMELRQQAIDALKPKPLLEQLEDSFKVS